MKTTRKHRKKKLPWVLHLYVANSTPRSLLAMANLQSLCDQYLAKGYRVRVIDIVQDPQAAARDDILATPTLRRVQPGPAKTVIGCLGNVETVLRGLDLGRPEAGHNQQPRVHLVQAAGEA